MASYQKPGAYIEWQDATDGAISPLRTDVAGFVGLARRGPVGTPVPVESYKQFESHFGTFTGSAFLAYAVRAFFDNGGRRCWVARVAAAGGARPAAGSSTLVNANGAPRWRIAASSPGTWGDDLTVSLDAVLPAQTASVGPIDSRLVRVESIAGFQRADLVRLSQPGLVSPLYRVVSFVDVRAQALYFVHPEVGGGLPYDLPLTGFDPDQPLQIASLAYHVRVRQGGRPLALFPSLSLVPEHPRYGPLVLPPFGDPLRPEVLGHLPAPPAPIVIEELAVAATEIPRPLEVTQGVSLPLGGGADGLADLTVGDFLGEPVEPADDEEAKLRKLRGIRAIDRVDEVAIVAAPDFVVQPVPEPEYDAPEVTPPNPCLRCPPPAPLAFIHQPSLITEMPPRFSDDDVYRMQSALLELCELRRDRMALLDPPFSTVSDGARGISLLTAWRAGFDSKHAATYYPWLAVVEPSAQPGGRLTRLVPPCGHAAGQYARADLEVGVHRAPANRVLDWVQDVGVEIDDARHGDLNLLGLNVIRAENGRGLRIAGARTLSSDPDWRYVNVRRLVMMVMKAIDVATQWAVFEPNDHQTRSKIALGLGELLGALWRRGALMGASPEVAFAVRCDEVNNPPFARENGQLVAEVALAPSVPFEYVVLRIRREANAFEIEETQANGVRR